MDKLEQMLLEDAKQEIPCNVAVQVTLLLPAIARESRRRAKQRKLRREALVLALAAVPATCLLALGAWAAFTGNFALVKLLLGIVCATSLLAILTLPILEQFIPIGNTRRKTNERDH